MEDYFKDLALIFAGGMIGVGISILTEKKPNNISQKESEK
jgi:hypothetical protein